MNSLGGPVHLHLFHLFKDSTHSKLQFLQLNLIKNTWNLLTVEVYNKLIMLLYSLSSWYFIVKFRGWYKLSATFSAVTQSSTFTIHIVFVSCVAYCTIKPLNKK